jgi:hypothetical protein
VSKGFLGAQRPGRFRRLFVRLAAVDFRSFLRKGPLRKPIDTLNDVISARFMRNGRNESPHVRMPEPSAAAVCGRAADRTQW